tara:strand:- start:723 stop:1070 length:348 start_codon:yes stop_codon:yes gene_type:complete
MEKNAHYQVHYKRPEKYFKGIKRGTKSVVAVDAPTAIRKVRQLIAGSYGHFVSPAENEKAVKPGAEVLIKTKHYGLKRGVVVEAVKDSRGTSWLVDPFDHPRQIMAETVDILEVK